MTTILDNILTPLKTKAKKRIIKTIKSEEDYIWTDSNGFSNSLLEITQQNKFDSDAVRNLLEAYYSAIKKIVIHVVPKIIMNVIVREIEKTLLSYLIQNIVSDDKIPLLKEDENIEKQRTYYSDLKNKIDSIKKSMPKTI